MKTLGGGDVGILEGQDGSAAGIIAIDKSEQRVVRRQADHDRGRDGGGGPVQGLSARMSVAWAAGRLSVLFSSAAAGLYTERGVKLDARDQVKQTSRAQES